MERRMETMLIEGDPARTDFEFLAKRFGGNEIVLCIFDIPDLWDHSGKGIQTVQKLGEAIREIHGVADVMDLGRLDQLLRSIQPQPWLSATPWLGTKTTTTPLLSPDQPFSKAMLELFEGYTHLRGQTTTAIVCVLDSSDSSVTSRRATIDAITNVIHHSPLVMQESLHGDAIGEPILIHDGFRLVEEDGRTLGIAAAIVLTIILLLGFRSWRWTLIAIFVVQWSQWVTEAIIAATDMELTMVSSMLASLVTIIGVATTIHWMMAYEHEHRNTLSIVESMRLSLRSVIRPIVFACLTDALGFASLLLAQVGPVRDYGLMMSLASMVVLASILLIIPGLATLGRSGTHLRLLPGDEWVRQALVRSLHPFLKYGKTMTTLMVVVVSAAIYGSLNMEVETDFIRNFRSDWPMVRAYDRIERQLGGAGVWDIMLPAPRQLTEEYLQSVQQFETKLRAIRIGEDYGLTKVLSLADAELASRSAPGSSLLSSSARLTLMETMMPGFFHAMVARPDEDEAQGWFRIMLRSPERASADEKLALIDAVHQETQRWLDAQSDWLGSSPSGEASRPRITGHFVLLTKLIDSLIADQWRCFFVATCGIGIALWIAIGRIDWVLIALVPNAIPALIVLGTMGWLGWKLNLGAALIAAVSIGISVDSSLHYLLRLRTELKAQKSLENALFACQRDVGMAMLLSTIALMMGFLWLTTSEFLPTVVFGASAALTMLGGLLGNLWLMPMWIYMLESRRRSTRTI